MRYFKSDPFSILTRRGTPLRSEEWTIGSRSLAEYLLETTTYRVYLLKVSRPIRYLMPREKVLQALSGYITRIGAEVYAPKWYFYES